MGDPLEMVSSGSHKVDVHHVEAEITSVPLCGIPLVPPSPVGLAASCMLDTFCILSLHSSYGFAYRQHAFPSSGETFQFSAFPGAHWKNSPDSSARIRLLYGKL